MVVLYQTERSGSWLLLEIPAVSQYPGPCPNSVAPVSVSNNLDKERVKLGDRDDGSYLLGWPTKLEIVESEQKTSSSTYLGCGRAKTVTLLPPGSQCCTP